MDGFSASKRAENDLSTTTVLSRQIAELGLYPAVDPLDSTSRILDPAIVGEDHYRVAREVQVVLQRYKDLQDIIAILGIDELSEDGRNVREVKKVDPNRPRLCVIEPTSEELEAHYSKLETVDRESNGNCLWKKMEELP